MKMPFLTSAMFGILLVLGCDASKPDPKTVNESGTESIEIQKTLLASRSQAGSETMFSGQSPESTGIQFTNKLLPEHNIKYLNNGEGVCAGDYDNDGLVDVFLLSKDAGNKLFRQVSPWKFEDVTELAGGLSGDGLWGTGASFADINNDGFLDLYVCNLNGPNRAWMNQHDGTFREEGKSLNIDFAGPTTMAAFADYDNDGDLDLYLVNNRIYTIGDKTKDILVIERNGEQVVHPDFYHEAFFLNGRLQEAGHRDVLYRNDDGKFVNVSDQAGIAGYDMGLSATWWDYDRDGHIDLFVGNDMKSPDHLYKNLGNGRFEDVLPDVVGHTAWFSMGADVADLNNDGLLDLVSADMSSTTHYKQKTTMGEMSNESWFLTIGQPRQFMRNAVFLNSGTSRFWEAANLTGLDSTDWTWSVKANDYDCDGLVDVFFTNGYGRNTNDSDFRKEYQKLKEQSRIEEAANHFFQLPALEESNLHFRNLGDLKFESVADKWGADEFGVSHGCSVMDIDRDGDLDMIVNHQNKPVGVYRNDCEQGSRLLVKLNGTTSNRFGINAMVTVESGGQTMTRQMLLARGYMSADEPLIHFGLGDATKIDRLTVQWPSGIVQEFENLEVDNLYTITEQGTPQTKSTPSGDSGIAMFEEVSEQVGLTFSHSELPYDDFQHQPLLPNKMSQLGPGMAWGDVNGDGKFDCYICGARGQTGKLLVAQPDGKFAESRGPWISQMNHEELSALFLDFDSDGDQDLYVVNGGYEVGEESELLRDVLYVNDGSKTFSKAADDVLPDLRLSGSSISAADFDRDGDLDLFVGTRIIPRQWPMPVSSTLLKNDNGRFIDVTAEIAPALLDIGLVTSSIWSDADNDGWVDLFVTLEWGAVRFLKNEQGKLVDRTVEAGLADELGWWNSIAAGDVDNDGDLDYVAMNTGLNTKYHTDKKHPITLYAHDFDQSGTLDLVESEWEGDKCFPIRGKSCSTHAMPMVSEKFQTYHEFALAELSDIYGDDSLSAAAKFTVNNLSSVLLVNDGKANFTIVELPRLAQVSPGFGVAMEDFDSDGNCDIAIAQNFMNPQPETGQMDGGMGLLLRGDGTGKFQPVGPKQSGIIVPEQGMALTVVDVNHDQIPDFAMTVNDGPVRVFENRNTTGDRKHLSITLDAGNGNKSGVGARVELVSDSGLKTIREIHAGDGYLSQSPGTVFCSFDPLDPVNQAIVRWPNGEVSTHEIVPGANTIKQSESISVKPSQP